MAAQILLARGIKATSVQAQFAKAPRSEHQAMAKLSASSTLESFLAGLRCQSDALTSLFAKNVVFIDVFGKRWELEEIRKHVDTLFAPYAKRNAAHIVEDTLTDARDSFVAVVLWKNATLASMERVWMHRMSVVLVQEGKDWVIALVQLTPVNPS